jgi:hypothetical protein
MRALMSGKLFAQIVALIALWGVVFFIATRLVDGRRNAYANAYLNQTRAAMQAAPSDTSVTDDRLMGNAEVALNAMDDTSNQSGE